MEDKPSPNVFVELIGGLWDLCVEMLEAFFEILPSVIGFIVWMILAIPILICTFVAAQIYPIWAEWGEKNF